MSGSGPPVVTLVGAGLVALVEAIPVIEERLGERPVIVGGLAVMCRLTTAYRATTDIDTVQRQTPGNPSHLEILLQSPDAEAAGPGVRIPIGSQRVKVDVVSVSEADIADPDEYPTGRLHILSHAWAQETASPIQIGVEQPGAGNGPEAQTARVAEPGPLVAMKLQAIENRSAGKKATDLVDVVRLILDPATRETALGQLSVCDPRIAGDVAWHAHKSFTVEVTETHKSVRSVSPDIELDTLRLVGEFLLGASITRVVEFVTGGVNANESEFSQQLYDTIWTNPSIATNERLLRLCRRCFNSSHEVHLRLFDALSSLPDLVDIHPQPNRVRDLINAIESDLAAATPSVRETPKVGDHARNMPMRVGLVGYFGFGNFGDELYRRVHQQAFDGHELSVLRGCDGIRPHDPVEVDNHDVIVIGGGDLVDPSQYLARYWNPVLLRRPVLIVGVGVNMARSPTPEGVRSLSSFFGHPNVQWISTRDEPSKQWIIENLAPAAAINVHPDLVASFDFPTRHPIEVPILGLVLRGGHPHDPSHVLGVMRRARELGYEVRTVILGTGTTASEDLAAIRRLNLGIAPVQCEDLEEIADELSRCTVVASERYHGCLAALLMGIPTIGLRTQISRKTETLFEGLGMSGSVFTIGSVALEEALAELPARLDHSTAERLRAEASAAVGEMVRVARHAKMRTPVPAYPEQSHSVAYHYGFIDDPRQRVTRLAERSPRLLADPSFDLDLGSELRWYRAQIRSHKGNGYLATLNTLIDRDPLLAELPPSTRAIVCIPVAGLHELSAIYGTLSLYGRQDPETLRRVVVLPYVNYPDDADTDPELSKRISQTIHQVQLAKTDFTRLQLAAVVEPFDHHWPTAHGGIIGYVARRMYDLAMMSVHRAILAGNISPQADILLIRNDADSIGMSRQYLHHLLKAQDSDPNADIFQGIVRWGTDTYTDYPGYGVVMTFKEAFRALAHRRSADYSIVPGTNGSNVAVRMATLAAVGGVGNSSYYGAGGDDVELGLRVRAARAKSRHTAFRFVPGAQIDASGERTLATYRSGQTITHSWDSFNRGEGGYQPRQSAATDNPIEPEQANLPQALDRIEENINELATSWFSDIQLVDAALRLVIGSHDDEDRPNYELGHVNGTPTVRLTPEGRQWIKHRIMGRRDGTPDPYGPRIRRALYRSPSTAARPGALIPALPAQAS